MKLHLGPRSIVRGMTLVEVTISLALVTVIATVSILVIKMTSDHMAFEMIASEQESRARSALDGMMEELRKMSQQAADFDTSTGVGTNTLTGGSAGQNIVTFAIPTFDFTTYTANMGNASTAISYQWVLNPREIAGNNIDDDYNGLVDSEDGQVQRTVGGASATMSIVTINVPQTSFLVVKSGWQLQIRVGRIHITPIVTDNGKKFRTTVSQNTYCLRNY